MLGMKFGSFQMSSFNTVKHGSNAQRITGWWLCPMFVLIRTSMTQISFWCYLGSARGWIWGIRIKNILAAFSGRQMENWPQLVACLLFTKIDTLRRHPEEVPLLEKWKNVSKYKIHCLGLDTELGQDTVETVRSKASMWKWMRLIHIYAYLCFPHK